MKNWMSFFILVSGIYQTRCEGLWSHSKKIAERSGETSVIKTLVATTHINGPWKIRCTTYFMFHEGTSRRFLEVEEQIEFENKLPGEISPGIGPNTRLVTRGKCRDSTKLEVLI